LLASLAAMWAGLLRLGWKLPPLVPTLAMSHGPLMVSGFMGTLISLERVVALNRKWTYTAPAATGLGVFALLIGLPTQVGAALMVLGSLGMVAIFAVIVRMHRAPYTVTMALGAVAWLTGNILWLMGFPIFRIVWWWGAFLILTITGERLEMSRVMRAPQSSHTLFVGIIVLLFIGLALVGLNFEPGWRITGAAMLAMSAWLLRYDIARRTVQQSGLTRFIALNLLVGFVWLGVSGILLIVFGQVFAGPRYDAALHTLLLGFVFGMIFGHAPIILPAVMGVPMTYRPAFYSHWALLHVSLAVRITGDLIGNVVLWQWGGLFNVFAVLLFLFNTVRVMVQARRADDHAQVSGRVSAQAQSQVGTFTFGIGEEILRRRQSGAQGDNPR